ncbi:hypothetical protein B0T16DRAFT_326817, partial [Cercophora newfieldiana]
MAFTFPKEASTISATKSGQTTGVEDRRPTPTDYSFLASISVTKIGLNNIAEGTFLQWLDKEKEKPAPDLLVLNPGDTLAGVWVPAQATTAGTTPTPEPTATTGRPLPTPDSGSNGGTSAAMPSNSSTGINTGAIAGAAVGCLVGGLLLGFAIAFFFLRRRKQAEQNGQSSPDESKAYFAAASTSSESKFPLDKFLLDTSPDKEIASELHSLGTLIQQHVENNYHLQPVHEDPRVLAVSLVQLGVASGSSLTPDVLAQLALDQNTRYVALQHVISQVLFTSVDVSSRSALSMLPAPVAAFLRSMPQKEAEDKSEGLLTNIVHPAVSSFALNQWRALSAFLLHPARSQRTPLPTSSAAVTSQAAALSNALDTFLGYFVAADEGSRSQQRSHLQAVIGETTKLGYVLLSQPSEWRFVHTLGQKTGGRVAVVCAGLVKVTDKDGTPYPAPKQVVAPQTVGKTLPGDPILFPSRLALAELLCHLGQLQHCALLETGYAALINPCSQHPPGTTPPVSNSCVRPLPSPHERANNDERPNLRCGKQKPTMEAAIAVGTLKVAYNLLIFGIKVDQVPAAVRRCVELVRTCHFDLEDLIKLRNESLRMLESKPAILTRVNTIIENARTGLLEVARLVEKLRPEVHEGNTPLRGRLEWLFVDSREFDSQEPLISRQHSSVIAELNFLRQLVLLT